MADNVTLNLGSGGDSIAADDISSVKHQRVKVEFGADGSATDVSFTDPLPIIDVGLAEAAGSFSNRSTVNKFGRNPDIDTAAQEVVWDGGGTWTMPTAARTHDIASDDGTDDGSPAANGARTVTIEGLDTNYALQSETVTMDGTTNVATANTYRMIHRMYVATGGASGANIGTITATAQTDSTITAQINPGKSQTQMAIYVVPASKTAYMHNYYGTINRATASGGLDLELRAQDLDVTDSVQRLRHIISVNVAGSSSVNHVFSRPLKFTEKTLIILYGEVNTNNTDVGAGFDLTLIDD